MSLHILILFSLFYHLGNKSVIYICTTVFNLIKWLISPKKYVTDLEYVLVSILCLRCSNQDTT